MDTVTSDVVHRVFLGDVFGFLSDHDSQFHFPVRLVRILRDHHIVERSRPSGGRFEKQHRFGRSLHARFRCVFGVVQANANNLRRPRDRGCQSHVIHFDRWQIRLFLFQELSQTRQSIVFKKRFVEVFAKGRTVDDGRFVGENGGLNGIVIVVSGKFHRKLLVRFMGLNF